MGSDGDDATYGSYAFDREAIPQMKLRTCDGRFKRRQ
jgi:hypothetical protein